MQKMQTIVKFFVFFGLVLSFSTVHATVNTWVGGTGSWHSPSNWSLGTVPGTGDSALVSSGQASFDLPISLAYLELSGGIIQGNAPSASIQVSGALRYTSNNPNYYFQAYFKNCTIIIASGGTLFLESYGMRAENLTIINNGTIEYTMNSGFDSAVEIINSGTIHIPSSVTQAGIPDIDNQGTITADGQVVIYTGTIKQEGTIQTLGGGRLQTQGARCRIYDNSIIAGFDTLSVSCYDEAGSFIQANAQISDVTFFEFLYTAYFSMDKSVPSNAVIVFEGVQFFDLNADIVSTNSLAILLENNIAGTGSITVKGSFIFAGSVISVPFSISPSATGYLCTYPDFPFGINAPFVNNGTLEIFGDNVLLNTNYFQNNGTVIFKNGGEIDYNLSIDATNLPVPETNVTIIGTDTLVNNGIFSNCNTNPIDVVFDIPVVNNGILEGTGGFIFNQSFVNNGSTNPGCSPGHMIVYGDFETGKRFNIEVEGQHSTQSDKLTVDGILSLGDTLSVSIPAGLTLTAPILIIESTMPISGSFSTIILPPGLVTYTNANSIAVGPSDILAVFPADLTVPATSGDAAVQILTNLNNWTVSDNATWLSVSPTSGSKNGNTILSWEENQSATQSRTALVTVRRGAPRTRTVTVTQGNANGDVCYRATAAQVQSVGTNSATISWNAAPVGAINYQIQYRQQGTSGWTNLTSTSSSQTLQNLFPASTYQWRIRTRCSAGTFSDYTKVQTFNTLAAPMPSNQWTGVENEKVVERSEFKTSSVFSIYPNPVTEILIVDWDHSTEVSPANITVYDLLGRVALSITDFGDERVEINAASLPKGMNRIVVRNEKGDLIHDDFFVVF